MGQVIRRQCGNHTEMNGANLLYGKAQILRHPSSLRSTHFCGGCPEFCVDEISLLLGHPVFELDSKPI